MRRPLLASEPAVAAPEGFDAVAYVSCSLARTSWRHEVEVLLDLPPEEATRRLPATLAELAPAPTGTLLRMRVSSLDWMARVLAGLDCRFTSSTRTSCGRAFGRSPTGSSRPRDYDAPMEALPSGTVTFVFTDIEHSTALLRRLGDEYGGVLAEHRRIVRETFAEHGVEIDTQGDAFFFAFPRAREAVGAAVEVQRAHAAREWPEGAAPRVRIGLHTGEPSVHEEGYLGLDVVRAARICTAAQGGHVLLSETTRALLGSELPEGVSVFPLGERHLKGIDAPERVYELEIDGIEPEPAAPEPVERRPEHAVPTRRDEEEVERRIDDLGDRLAAGVEEQVAARLERAFARLERAFARLGGPPRPPAAAREDADVEDLAARSVSLEERIRARVEAALRARGITPHK